MDEARTTVDHDAPLRRWTIAALAAGAVLCAALAVCRVHYLDEGWYVYAGKSVYEGKLPYRDFCYTQSPLLPYLYGITTLVQGWGIFGARALSWAMALTACVVTVTTARRVFGAEAAMVSALFLLASVHAQSFYAAALTYGPAVFWLALAMAAALGKSREPWRTGLCMACAVAAVGIRLSAAAVVPVLVLWSAGSGAGRTKRAAWASLWTALLLAVAFLPFVWQRMDVAFGEMLSYHLVSDAGQARWLRVLHTLAQTGVAYGLLVAAAIVGAFAAAKSDPAARAARLCAAAVAVLFVVHLMPATTDPHYFAILVPTAALAAGPGMVWMLSRLWPSRGKRLAALGLVVALHFGAQAWQAHRDGLLPWGRGSWLAWVELDRVGQCIAAQCGPNEPVLTFQPALALHAGRRLVSGAEMGPFGFRPTWDNAACERHRVLNWDLLTTMVADGKPAVIVLAGEDLKSAMRRSPPETVAAFQSALRRGYEPVAQFMDFGQFRDKVLVVRRRHGGGVAMGD